jgi:aminoglycoside phosphotransferase (APT) family kinase protein
MMDDVRSLRAPHATAVGFDTATVEIWLRTVTELESPVQWARLPGGHSNLTYLLSDARDRELVIRRPPEGHLAPRAHDMGREYRIIEALWPTSVPVPEPVAYCDDPSVAETHFYVMSRCPGEALTTPSATEDWLDVPSRRQAGESFVDVLAALHALAPADIGLANLGRPDHYVSRQISRWYESWTSQIEKAGYDDPNLHEVHDILVAQIPEQGTPRIVHGDYGPHNALFEKTGEISAVLDWEMATLGDPLADFAYAVNAWAGQGDEPADGSDAPTDLPGFLTRDEIVERYIARTGADLSHFWYYRVFNYWKRACILQGVYARYRSGQKSTDGVDLPNILRRIGESLGAAVVLAPEIS